MIRLVFFILLISQLLGGSSILGGPLVNKPIYKPGFGPPESLEKSVGDVGLRPPSALSGQEIWLGDPKLGQTLQTALSAIGSKQITLHVPFGAHVIDSNLVVKNNISLIVHRGAVLHINNGVTLTLSCPIEAGPYQIFSWSGSGKVLIGASAVDAALFRWWGAKGDNATDDTAAIQAAITCMNNMSGDYKGFNLVGSPGDVYLIDEITYKDTTHAAIANPSCIDGRGATLRQRQVGGNLLKVTGSFKKLIIKNWAFVGHVNHVWESSGLNVGPTAVLFNGTHGTKKTAISSLNNEKDWYWDESASKLYLRVATPSLKTPNDIYKTIVADATPLSVTKRFYSGCGLNLGNSSGVTAIVQNCSFQYLDRGLYLHYCLLSQFSDLRFFSCNNAIYAVSDKGNCHMNSFRDIYAAAIYGDDAIHMENAYGNSIDTITTEYIRNRVAFFSRMRSLRLNNWGMEAQGFGTCTENFLFKTCEGVTIQACNLWLGGTNATVGIKFQSATRGVTIENCQISSGIPIYDASSDCSGITFRNNQNWSQARWCKSNVPVALIENNSPGPGAGYSQWFTLPVEMVKVRIDRKETEYSTVNPSFTQPLFKPVTLDNRHAVSAVDGKTGFDDRASWKITWTGSGPFAQLGNFFTYPPNGTYYHVLSFFYKSNITQKINVIILNGSAYLDVPVAGDGQWRYFCGLAGSATTFPVTYAPHGIKIEPDANFGDLWIDCISLKWFPTLAQAVSWAGSDSLIRGYK